VSNLLNHLNLQVCSVYGNRIIGRYNHKESHSALLILWQEMHCVFWYGKICMVNISMVVIILLFQGLKHSGVFCPVLNVYWIWTLLVINYTEPFLWELTLVWLLQWFLLVLSCSSSIMLLMIQFWNDWILSATSWNSIFVCCITTWYRSNLC
jgi:hypothetical protein